MNYGYATPTEVLCEDCAFIMRIEAGLAYPDADPLELPNSVWPTGPFQTPAVHCSQCGDGLRAAPSSDLMRMRGMYLARVLGGALDGAEVST